VRCPHTLPRPLHSHGTRRLQQLRITARAGIRAFLLEQSADDSQTSVEHHQHHHRCQSPPPAMLSSGFTNAPVTRSLLVAVVLSAFLATITDTKYYLWIEVRPHLFDYHQFWRLLTWQFCYTNSTEVLFAAMTLYQLRVIERLWGSRKFAVRYLPTTTTSSNPTWKRQWMEPQTR